MATPAAHDVRNELLRLATVQLEYVPNYVTPQGKYWLPDEPLIPFGTLHATGALGKLTSLSQQPFDEDVRAETEEKIRNSERDRLENLDLKLRQILQHCERHHVDVVVLPMCVLPVALIKTILGWRSKLAVFAGLGYIGDEDAEVLKELDFEVPNHLPCHAAVFVSDDESKGESRGQRVLVTKRNHGVERGKMSDGLTAVRLRKGDVIHRLGLGIALEGHQFGDGSTAGGDRMTAVVMSALVEELGEMLTEPAGNCVKLVANHAAYGGTAVLMTGVSAPGFVDRHGTEPLPSQCEAVVIVDYEKPSSAASSSPSTQNRLVGRSAILYADGLGSEDASGSASGFAEQMGEWGFDQYRRGAYADLLRAGSVLVGDSREYNVLKSSLDILVARQRRTTLDEMDFGLLTSHAVLTDVKSEAELRYLLLDQLFNLWQRAQRTSEQQNLGELCDVARDQQRTLAARVRPRYLGQGATPRQRPDIRGPREPNDHSQHGGAGTFFASRLGSYDAENAVQSLPRQLAVLRSLALSTDHSIRLIYRASTTLEANGNLNPFFDVFGITDSTDQSQLDDLAEGIGQQMGAAFSGAWDISGTPEQPTFNMLHQVEIRLRPGTIPSIQEDWAGLVDYLRTLTIPVSVQLVCLRVPDGHDRIETDERLIDPGGFITQFDRDAAAFLARAAVQANLDEARLTLRVQVGSQERLAPSIVRTIGLWLFRSESFDIFDGDDARNRQFIGIGGEANIPLTPAEMLRIFHPPYGVMEARGLGRRRARDIMLPATAVTVGGVVIGEALTALGRSDKKVDVRIDPETRLRHMFVIGRTGSGKTNLLKYMARQDIREKRGIAVIDPHGDLVDYLLGQVGDREAEVLLLDFGDPMYVPVLNPLDLDIASPDDRRLAIEEFIYLLVHQSYHEFYGPRFEDIVRLTLESITRPEYPVKPPSVLDLVRILRTEKHRLWIRNLLQSVDLQERWDIFEAQQSTEIAEVLHWALSKFSEMQQDSVLGQVLAGGKSTVSIKQIVNEGGILLVKIPEWAMSRSAAAFLGAMIQERVRKAMYSRPRPSPDILDYKPYYLYVDEFQAFATSGFEELLAESRKFGLGLVLANQNLGQLTAFSRFSGTYSTALIDAVLGNVANIVTFGVSSRDEEVLARELSVPQENIRYPGKWRAVARISIDGEPKSFTLTPPRAESYGGLPEAWKAIRTRMIQTAWIERKKINRDIVTRERRIRKAVETSQSKPRIVADWMQDLERAERELDDEPATEISEPGKEDESEAPNI
jgi:hypothetical protein